MESQKTQCLFLLPIAIILQLTITAQAQWVEKNSGLFGPPVEVKKVLTIADKIFAVTAQDGTFLLDDQMTSWTHFNTALDFSAPPIAVSTSNDTVLFAANLTGVFMSVNDGTVWTLVSTELAGTPYVLMPIGTTLFAGTSTGVYKSVDNGAHWLWSNTGLVHWAAFENTPPPVFSLAFSNSTIFAGTDSGVFTSTDSGSSWIFASNGLPTYSYSGMLLISGNNIFLGTTSGLFMSDDEGSSWKPTNIGIGDINSMALRGTTIFTGTNNGVYMTNDGLNWIEINVGIGNDQINTMLVKGTDLFVGTASGIFVLANGSDSWEPRNSGLPLRPIEAYSFTSTAGRIYVGTNNGVFLSEDFGDHWITKSSGLTNPYIRALVFNGDNLFAGTSGNGVFLSADHGDHWTKINANLKNFYIAKLFVLDTTVFVGANGVYAYSRNGTKWMERNDGLPNSNVSSVLDFASIDGDLFAAIYVGPDVSGLYRSTDYGLHWTNIQLPDKAGVYGPGGRAFDAICTAGKKIFVGLFHNSNILENPGQGGLYSSDDSGQWIGVIPGIDVFDLFCNGSLIVVNGGSYISTDAGIKWTKTNHGGTACVTAGDYLFSNLSRSVWRVSIPLLLSDNTGIKPTSILSFAPNTGPIGSMVTITGTGFTDSTRVYFQSQYIYIHIVYPSTVEALIVSQTSTSITVVVPGAISGTITVVGEIGLDTSNSPFVIEVVPPNSVYSVYPNPVANALTVDLTAFGTKDAVEITIYDVLGRTVEKSFKTGHATIDVSSFFGGTYILKLSQQNRSYFARFVKE